MWSLACGWRINRSSSKKTVTLCGACMSQRILAVDDDADVLTLIRFLLKRYGIEVIEARSGAEALGFLAHDLPDLVILDVMMPEMDGYEVCRHIRANPRTAHLPVVMLTARTQLESRVEAFRAGADDYVTKPVHAAELVARLQAILEHSASGPVHKEGRAISVLGARGGVGATTLAVNLALALTAQARTILADLEVGGMAAAHLSLNPPHGLNNLLTLEVDTIDQASVEAVLTPHSSGLRLLAAADGPVDSARVGAVFNRLLSLCDVCVFDLGAGLGQITRTIAQRSQDFILVLDSDRVGLMQVHRVMHGLDEARLPHAALKLVWINRLGISAENAQSAIRASLGYDPVAIIGPAANAMYDAIEQGQPLLVSQPDHPAAVQMRALAASLMCAA
jgi:DNA-binding response OmpR family regulator